MTRAAILATAATILAAVASVPASPGRAQMQPAEAGATGQRIVYVPPMRGAPSGRVGGGTRGPAADLPEVEVLAPDHLGLSATDRPTLMWFLGGPSKAPVEVVVDTLEMTGAPPLLELTLPHAPAPGIVAVDLAANGVRLRPGVTYRWSVALVVDPDQRSSDVVASALIRHLPPEGKASRPGGDAVGAALDFAARGYWYDALSTLTKAILARPGDGELRRLRAELLRQVDLTRPAEHALRTAR
jgi:hypothetical protein